MRSKRACVLTLHSWINPRKRQLQRQGVGLTCLRFHNARSDKLFLGLPRVRIAALKDRVLSNHHILTHIYVIDKRPFQFCRRRWSAELYSNATPPNNQHPTRQTFISHLYRERCTQFFHFHLRHHINPQACPQHLRYSPRLARSPRTSQPRPQQQLWTSISSSNEFNR